MELALLSEIEALVGAIAERVGPAVVGLGRGWGRGSGVVFAPGLVLTNAHNLRDEETTVVFGDGRREPGRIAGADPDLDVAVLAAETGGVEPVAWDPGAGPARLGQTVLALGDPGGRGLRVTHGFVSAAARSFRGPRGRRIDGAIEHTAPLPRGSAGGPLVDAQGRLLGINSVRQDGGLILALPAGGALRARVEGLGRGEPAARLRLGVAIVAPPVARRLRRATGLPDRDGVLVRGVEPRGPADRAGVARGDLIATAGGRELDRVDVLYEVLDAATPGEPLELTILRGSDERAITVEPIAG